jgi:hypothetical protein
VKDRRSKIPVYRRLTWSFLESVFDDWLIHLQTFIDYQGSSFPEGEIMAYFLFDNPIGSLDNN